MKNLYLIELQKVKRKITNKQKSKHKYLLNTLPFGAIKSEIPRKDYGIPRKDHSKTNIPLIYYFL
jgi:hypothetical protein